MIEEDELKDNIDTLEITLFQVLEPTKVRKMHGYSSNRVVIGVVPTSKIKQSWRVHFDLGEGDWIYNRRQWVRVQKRSKLHPRGDGPFHVLALIGDKNHNLDQDSRTNPFKREGLI